MFRKEMRNPSANARSLRVCNDDFTLNDAICIELALNAYRFIGT